MSIPKYKVHGFKELGRYQKEYPATNEIALLVEQAASLGAEGCVVVLYVAVERPEL